ncbi:hypothetical protein JCM10213_001662 [Rhodosporidiobolus nylandii]
MPRLSALLPALALAGLARSQNASTTATSATSTATGSAAPAVETVVSTPAYNTAQEGQLNATVTAGWSTDSGMGTLTQGFTLLHNSTTTENNGTVYGLVLGFNATIALSNETTASNVPWLAYISCDQTTVTVNSTASNSSSLFSASASATSAATASAASASASAASNGTADEPQVATLSLIDMAAELGAKGVILYSDTAQSCSLNYTSFTNSTTNATTLPIFTSPSLEIHNILHAQFDNVPLAYTYYNSTLLSESLANLSTIISSASNTTLQSASSGSGLGPLLTSPTYYLLARIVPYYTTNSSSNGVVATIGRATPTSTGSRPGATGNVGGGDNSGDSSGATPRRSKLSLAAGGFVGGAVIAGLGLLV